MTECDLLKDVVTNLSSNGSNGKITTPMRHAAAIDAMWFEKVIIHTNWLRTDVS